MATVTITSAKTGITYTFSYDKPRRSSTTGMRGARTGGIKFDVQCQECCKRFKSASASPKCPKCGSYDIDIC